MVGHQSQIDHDVRLNDQARGETLDVGRHLDNTRQQRDDILSRASTVSNFGEHS
jgi:hypothetical protein